MTAAVSIHPANGKGADHLYTINTVPIGAAKRGIRLTTIIDPKFKVSSIQVCFTFPRVKETAAADSLLAYILEDTNSDYPDMTLFNKRLSELYGASLSTSNRSVGNYRELLFSAGTISDKYALDGEELSYELMKMICGCIFEPAMQDGGFTNIELKRNELIDDITSVINDKRSYALKQAAMMIYEGEPSGYPLRGEVSDAKAVTNDDLIKAYNRLLETARIEIFFAGSSVSQKFIQLVNERFSSIRRTDVCSFSFAPSAFKTEVREKTETLDVVQCKMVLAFKHGESFYQREDIITVFAAVYGRLPTSLLFKNVREKMSLCYYCAVSPSWSKAVFTVDSGLEAVNTETAKNEILHQLDLIKKGEFADDLIDQAKTFIKSSYRVTGDSPSSVISWYLDRSYYGPVDTPEEHSRVIEKVTKEDIIAFANSLVLDSVYLLKGAES